MKKETGEFLLQPSRDRSQAAGSAEHRSKAQWRMARRKVSGVLLLKKKARLEMHFTLCFKPGTSLC